MSLPGRNWLPAAADPAAMNDVASGKPPTRARGSRLFAKYAALFVAVVTVALLFSGVFDALFYYREHRDALVRIQREQAEERAPMRVSASIVMIAHWQQPNLKANHAQGLFARKRADS